MLRRPCSSVCAGRPLRKRPSTASVPGAAANELAAAVPDEVKEERWHRFMRRQQAISARRLKRRVGTRQQVIIDEVGNGCAKGRTKGDAPEIDGTVHVT